MTTAFSRVAVFRWLLECLLFPRDGTDRALARINEKKNKPARRLGYALLQNPSSAEIGRLVLGTLGAREQRLREKGTLARDAFAGVSDAMLKRYALPEAAAALAASDPDRVRSLLRAGREGWKNIHLRLSSNRRFSLAVTSAYLGDAQGVALFASGLPQSFEVETLKQRFAQQRRVARKLGARADYPSVRKAALSSRAQPMPAGVRRQGPVIGLLDGVDLPTPLATSAKAIPVDRDFPLALATVESPVWLPVWGSFGKKVYPGHTDFPFPGNVNPLFTEFHISDLEILDDATLKYLRRFMPIGCRDLLTVQLLRGAGVKAFLGENGLPQSVLEGIFNGRSKTEIYAIWRKHTAPAMARTDALIAEANAKHPPLEIPPVNFRLSRADQMSGAKQSNRATRKIARRVQRGNPLVQNRVQVRFFGTKGYCSGSPDKGTIHLLFGFDTNQAEFFPSTFEGIWRYTARPLVVHIFGRGLSTAMFECWAAQFCRPGGAQREASICFAWYDLSGVAFGDINLLSHISVSAMDRLLAPALLSDVEKVVYLDIDVLIRKDVSRLFDMRLGEALFAARRDPDNNVGTGAKQLGLHATERKFTEGQLTAYSNAFFTNGPTVFEGHNSGIMVMNLDAMRSDSAVEKTLAIAQTCGADDQSVLNLYGRGRWKPLARKWNHFPFSELIDDPAIVHFAGIPKPWAPDWFVAFWKDWQDNARTAASRL